MSPDGITKCPTCKGEGRIRKTVQLGPGMISQSIGACDACEGKGEKIKDKDRCKKCKGKKVVDDIKLLEVQIDKGCPDGERYTFHGEADEYVTHKYNQ